MVVALITAAGKGKRMKTNEYKQYIPLRGIPIFAITLKRFEESKVIDGIYVILPREKLSYSKKIIESFNFKKIMKMIPGGNERQDSVMNGICELEDECDYVVIHDAVRPFISNELIEMVVLEGIKYGAAILGVPVKDTIKVVNDGKVIDTPDRDTLWQSQTPQVFRYDILKKAYEKAKEDGFYGTDDACLVERIGIGVKVIEGSYDNIKITTEEDLIIGEEILKKNEGRFWL